MEKDSSKLTNKLIIGEGVAILCAMLTCFAWLHGQIQHQNDRLDQHIAVSQEAIAAQSARSDQLYTMFYDLLKEGREK